MANIVLPTKDRGTFFFNPANASQVSKPVLDDRLACRTNPDETACVGDQYSSGGANGSWKELVDCVPLEDLNISLTVTTRNGTTSVADIQEGIQILLNQILPTLSLI